MFKKITKQNKFLNPSELSIFFLQLAMMLKGGVSVNESILFMCDDTESSEAKDLLDKIYAMTDSGHFLYEALNASERFPHYAVDMIAIGEKTGRLDDVCDSLGNYYERAAEISKDIRHAFLYPSVMVVLMLIVIGILFVEILPVFYNVFELIGAQMSPFALGLLEFGRVISVNLPLILLVIAIIVSAVFIFKNSRFGKGFISNLFESFILTRNLAKKLESNKFAFAMSLMLASGLSIPEALEMAYNLTEGKRARQRIASLTEMSSKGVSLDAALKESGIFPGAYTRIISSTIKTGMLDSAMSKISSLYEKDVSDNMAKILSFIEPSLVFILAILVGAILLSVILPLVNVMTAMV